MEMISKEPQDLSSQGLPPGNNGSQKVVKTVEISSRTGKPKRRKALRACTNCQRTHLTCDDDRPCERCVKRGCADTCVDGVRKRTKPLRQQNAHQQHHRPGITQMHALQKHPVRHSHELQFPGSALDGIPDHYSSSIMTEDSLLDPSGKRASRATHSVSTNPLHNNTFPPQYPSNYGSQTSPHSKASLLGPQAHLHSRYDRQHAHLPQHQHESYYGFEPGGIDQTGLNQENLGHEDHIYHQIPGAPPSDILDPSGLPAQNVQAYSDHPRQGPYSYPISDPQQAYQYMPQYFEPLDSYPLVPPRQPTIKEQLPPTENGNGQAPDTEHENESVISAMLRGRSDSNVSGSAAPPIDRGRKVSTSISPLNQTVGGVIGSSGTMFNDNQVYQTGRAYPVQTVEPTPVHSSDSGSLVKSEQGASSWSDLPVNPIVSAHNDQSGRYFYGSDNFAAQSDVFRNVTEPFPYLQAFQRHYEALQLKLTPDQMKSVRGILTKIVNLGLAVTRPLSLEDNVFVEQCFQRSLMEERKQFALPTTACLVWRRSGNIVAVSPRFTKMTQWTMQLLPSEFITSIMDNESVVTYFKRVESIYSTSNKEFKFNCTLTTPQGKAIHTEVEVTAQKDLFNMPLTIVGKFWERPS